MQLAQREKYLISLAGIVIVCAVVIQFMLMPFLEKKERYENNVTANQENLQQMMALRQEYLLLEQDSDVLAQRLARRPNNFTLFSFLEKAAGDAVEMKLERVTLGQMVGYLKLIESPENLVSIKRISIQSNKKDTQFIDVVLQVLTYTE